MKEMFHKELIFLPASVIQNVCTPLMWLTTLVFKIKKLLQTFQAIVKGYKAV